MTSSPHIMIVESSFYPEISKELMRGAMLVLEGHEATFERFTVPGSFEIPAAIQMAIRSMDFFSGRKRFDGYVALGCVIRGETSHYDIVCQETSRALQDLALRYTLALGFGVLTCETREQAIRRASVNQLNRGAAAAKACLAMIDLKRKLHLYPR